MQTGVFLFCSPIHIELEDERPLMRASRERDLSKQVEMAREQLRDLRSSNESTHAKLLDHNQRIGEPALSTRKLHENPACRFPNLGHLTLHIDLRPGHSCTSSRDRAALG